MFFKQVYRNARKNRRGNVLLYGSLVVAIVAFYTLLSLPELDVMRFLTTIESDAVGKLMTLVPLIYFISLFFVYFMVFLACKHELSGRRKEFGLYLTLGMKKSRLFMLLLTETLYNSLISLIIGLPTALFLAEGISLGSARLIGLGIIGHRVSFSPAALCWTIAGFVAVQLICVAALSFWIVRTPPAKLIADSPVSGQSIPALAKSRLALYSGILALAGAYALGLFGLGNDNPTGILLVFPLVILGIAGTFLVLRGLGGLIGMRLARAQKDRSGLSIFNRRQIQENVLHQYKSLAVSSLLLLMALSTLAYAVSIVGVRGANEERTTDYSIFGESTTVQSLTADPAIARLTGVIYPLYLAQIKEEPKDSDLREKLSAVPGGSEIAENLHLDYLIAASSYNDLLRALGRAPLQLADDQMALYFSMNSQSLYATMQQALKQGVTITFMDKRYTLAGDLCHTDIVADRAITLYTALIVPDRVYREAVADQTPYCWNLHLNQDLVNELGLMQAIRQMNGLLDQQAVRYTSYLGGIGRNLFYTVAGSYLTAYLGILFLIIANTVIGLKFLAQQRQTRQRYVTLLALGATIQDLKAAVNKQITAFFSLVLGLALINSVFAIYSLFAGFTRLPKGTSLPLFAGLAAAALLLFAAGEIVYVLIVRRLAAREMEALALSVGR